MACSCFTRYYCKIGAFHRAENFMVIIGKRMQSSGFSEILEAANLFSSSQVEMILNACHYNRGIAAQW